MMKIFLCLFVIVLSGFYVVKSQEKQHLVLAPICVEADFGYCFLYSPSSEKKRSI